VLSSAKNGAASGKYKVVIYTGEKFKIHKTIQFASKNFTSCSGQALIIFLLYQNSFIICCEKTADKNRQTQSIASFGSAETSEAWRSAVSLLLSVFKASSRQESLAKVTR